MLYAVTKLFEPIARKTKKETQEANANYNGELTNILNGLEVIKLYQVEANFKRPFESIVKVLEQIKKRSFRIDEFQSNLNHWIAGTYQMVIYVYATYLYIQESITLTALILVFNLIGQLIWSMISGFNFINRFRTSVDIYNRITATTDPIKATEKMSFKQGYQAVNLSFAYDEKQVFSNLNLR